MNRNCGRKKSLKMNEVLIGMGSNLGDRTSALRSGCKRMLQLGIKILDVSSLYESVAVGYSSPNPFLNAVVKAETSLQPYEILAILKQIELEAGRLKSVGYTDRPLDLDLLFYGALVLRTDELELPHPRMHERGFVLLPATELAPEFCHPILKTRLKDLLHHLNFDHEEIYRFQDANWLHNV